MKAIALLIIALLWCSRAWCQLMEIHFPGADVIVDATIQEVRSVPYSYGKYSDNCGFIYKATVTESFRGRHSGTILFGSNAVLRPQGRYLLLLQRFEGEFPTDSSVIWTDPDDPHLHANLMKARNACLASLPRLKTYSHPMGWPFHREMLASADGTNHLVHGGNNVHGVFNRTIEVSGIRVDGHPAQPDDIARFLLPGGRPVRVTEWEELRQWLHANVPDKRPRYRAPTLKDADARLRRSVVESRRHFAARHDVLAALETSRRAWEDFARAACDVVIAVWPMDDLRDPLLNDCRRGAASEQAAELESLLHESAQYGISRSGIYYFSDDDCDDACRALDLKVTAQFMEEEREDMRERFDDRPNVIAAMDASMDAWDLALQARCALVTTIWPESGLHDSLLLRCRLRSMGAWTMAQALLDENYNEVMRNFHLKASAAQEKKR